MKVFDDIAAERPRIEQAIKKYGYAPEHHFRCYEFSCNEEDKNIFVQFDEGALLTMKDRNGSEQYIFSSPLAPPEHRVSIMVKYLKYLLQEADTHKVWLELEAPLRRELLRSLPDSLRAMPINYTLVWPVMDMRTFDPKLPGGHYKSTRKDKHKFYRDHFVEVRDAKTFEDKEELHRIVNDWKVRRGPTDRAYTELYHHMIDANFDGTGEARVFMVDGKPVGFNAGWMIPNSDRFYGAVGIHDYSVEELGRMLYLEDLVWLKLRGYGEVDMAGGEKALTQFKNRFTPAFSYKTFIFSVTKRNAEVEQRYRPQKVIVLK